MVCAESFLKTFRFSRDFQCSVKVRRNAQISRRDAVSHAALLNSSSYESILTFIRRIATQKGNSLPDCKDDHPRITTRRKCISFFSEHFKALEKTTLPVPSYFYVAWKRSDLYIKKWKVKKFTLCSICEDGGEETYAGSWKEWRSCLVSPGGPKAILFSLVPNDKHFRWIGIMRQVVRQIARQL